MSVNSHELSHKREMAAFGSPFLFIDRSLPQHSHFYATIKSDHQTIKPVKANALNPDLLLHVCCAPCSIVPLEKLQQAGHNLLAYYYNPNIHPQSEYQLRLDTFTEYAQKQNVKMLPSDYQPELWEKFVAPLGGPYPLIEGQSDFAANQAARSRRCTACYRLRFQSLAAAAQTVKIANIATTLTISPYQFTNIIVSEIASAARQYNISALQADYSSFYHQSTTRSRELAMYRQNYCGCRYSQQEAQIERETRKAIKARRKKETNADIRL
jgi:predicted adenine nucleotide alpha hydrolase (AANH) superfamily ATPase